MEIECWARSDQRWNNWKLYNGKCKWVNHKHAKGTGSQCIFTWGNCAFERWDFIFLLDD